MACVFCSIEGAILKNDLAYAKYDNYPVTPGHILIIPHRHVADYFDITPEEHSAIHSLLNDARKLLIKERSPDGFNFGVNVGKTAGQTIFHVHVHLIPRYKGDMPNPSGGVRGVIPDKQQY